MKFNYDKKLRSHTQSLGEANTLPQENFQDYGIANGHESKKPIAAWRLWVPLVIQTILILSVPAQAVYTHLTGKTVVLQTVPVDPYNPFSGYSVRLSYDISGSQVQALPGWAELVKQHPGGNGSVPPGTSFYVILEQPKSSGSLPEAWKAVRVSSDRPASVAANQVALKGVYTYGSIRYGLETYYIPEAQREQINKDIAQERLGRQEQRIVVEAKVDAQGHAVPISFWVSDRNYRF